MNKFFKIIGIILLVIIAVGGIVYFGFLRYPELKNNPKQDKWYRVSTDKMKDSEGGKYHAFFKKGSENKVLVYFAGGGVSIDEVSARNDTYNTKMIFPDALSLITMNMGGIASNVDGNPFKDWTVIAFPYATGDFHSGTGEYKYVDKDGKEKILYHNGYTNFTETMNKVLKEAGIENPESVLVAGYSAGGWGASLLADDVFSNYFPDVNNKNVLVDASVGLYDDWKNVAQNVWKSPEHIVDRIKTNNISLDSLIALHEKYKDEVSILFDVSTRDGDLAKVQRYFNTKEIDEQKGEMPLEEVDVDNFENFLKTFIPELQEKANATVFVYNGIPWYDDPRDFTVHTIIAEPRVYQKLNDTDKSIAEWINDNVNGIHQSYGLELLENN